MVIRVFRARPKPGFADELADLIEQISIPFIDRQPGLLARHTGRGLGATGDEIVMISVWESLDAMKRMSGEDWESAVFPDARLAERIEASSIRNYESIG